MTPDWLHTYPMSTTIGYMKSPLGLLRLEIRGAFLAAVQFVEEENGETGEHRLLKDTTDQLDEYFKGTRKEFSLPLMPFGTHFQQTVWDQLLKIPYGQTIAYEQLARRLGDIKVIRAAAAANGRNPLAIVVPCHRVVGKDGSLTGYSGGLWRKKWLLDHEMSEKAPGLF